MKNIFILTLTFFALCVNGQDSKKSYSFTLQQAIDHALEYNYSAINSGRDIEAAKEKKWETTAMGLPQINAGADFTNNFVLQKSVVPAEFFGGEPGTYAEVAFGTKYNMVARSTLSQLIFDGSYIVALQASKTYLAYYENAKKRSDIDIKEMIINSYGNVLLAQENIAILEKNISSLQKTLNDTRATYKNGLIEEESVEQLEINLASLESTLNYNKRLLDITYKMLKINLGIDINDQITLTDKLDILTVQNMDLSFSNTEFDVNSNIDYRIATNFEEQRTLEYKLERSKALPSLAANVNFGYTAFKDEFDFFSKNQNWFNYSNLGLSLNIPIFSSLARSSRTQQAKIALDQAKTTLSETEQKLKLQYATAKTEYEYSIADYETAKSNLNLAERIERKQQIKFTEGLSTSFDFNDAQRQLYTAQQKYLQTMVDIINKRASLEKITTK
ncbi:TolC family protein [Flavobacterium granuli]|uniref:Outer membrane protein TolC n=1 Tax=Flavobacterium granuli TaxID=280093 RepID=A0ABU1S2Q2_9FLAO|nr:TolC family protein [Flavobacterium granuli]MDR6845317.1 outer membrane protein TolC [Flavobacterium granuli]